MTTPTVLIVPGLRDAVAQHWQTLLEARLRAAGRPVASVPPMGRDDLDCATKVAAIERVAQSVSGPIVIVAHSGGCIMVAHWAKRRSVRCTGRCWPRHRTSRRRCPRATRRSRRSAPAAGCRCRARGCRFRSIVAASRNDPLADYDRVVVLARSLGQPRWSTSAKSAI